MNTFANILTNMFTNGLINEHVRKQSNERTPKRTNKHAREYLTNELHILGLGSLRLDEQLTFFKLDSSSLTNESQTNRRTIRK